jgi:hypothetical protein
MIQLWFSLFKCFKLDKRKIFKMNWHKIFGSNYFKFIVFIIFLNVNSCQRLGRKQLPCNQNSTLNEVDRIIARMLPFGNPEARFAETLEELKIRCE